MGVGMGGGVGGDHTCHVLKGECGWGIAPRVTLLVSHPGFIQVLHEAVLVRTAKGGMRAGGVRVEVVVVVGGRVEGRGDKVNAGRGARWARLSFPR